MVATSKSRIIFLNGTSSAGKSSVATELRALLPKSYCFYASDQLAEAGFRALKSSEPERQHFFAGFHCSIAAFASRNNDLVIEHIVEQQDWANDLRSLLAPFDTFWVGIHCSLEALRAIQFLSESAKTECINKIKGRCRCPVSDKT